MGESILSVSSTDSVANDTTTWTYLTLTNNGEIIKKSMEIDGKFYVVEKLKIVIGKKFEVVNAKYVNDVVEKYVVKKIYDSKRVLAVRDKNGVIVDMVGVIDENGRVTYCRNFQDFERRWKSNERNGKSNDGLTYSKREVQKAKLKNDWESQYKSNDVQNGWVTYFDREGRKIMQLDDDVKWNLKMDVNGKRYYIDANGDITTISLAYDGNLIIIKNGEKIDKSMEIDGKFYVVEKYVVKKIYDYKRVLALRENGVIVDMRDKNGVIVDMLGLIDENGRVTYCNSEDKYKKLVQDWERRWREGKIKLQLDDVKWNLKMDVNGKRFYIDANGDMTNGGDNNNYVIFY